MEWNALVPELVVADYERSKAFYVADPDGYLYRFCEYIGERSV